MKKNIVLICMLLSTIAAFSCKKNDAPSNSNKKNVSSSVTKRDIVYKKAYITPQLNGDVTTYIVKDSSGNDIPIPSSVALLTTNPDPVAYPDPDPNNRNPRPSYNHLPGADLDLTNFRDILWYLIHKTDYNHIILNNNGIAYKIKFGDNSSVENNDNNSYTKYAIYNPDRIQGAAVFLKDNMIIEGILDSNNEGSKIIINPHLQDPVFPGYLQDGLLQNPGYGDSLPANGNYVKTNYKFEVRDVIRGFESSNITLKNLFIDANKCGTYLISFEHCNDVLLENIEIINTAGTGFAHSAGLNMTYVNCIVRQNQILYKKSTENCDLTTDGCKIEASDHGFALGGNDLGRQDIGTTLTNCQAHGFLRSDINQSLTGQGLQFRSGNFTGKNPLTCVNKNVTIKGGSFTNNHVGIEMATPYNLKIEDVSFGTRILGISVNHNIGSDAGVNPNDNQGVNYANYLSVYMEYSLFTKFCLANSSVDPDCRSDETPYLFITNGVANIFPFYKSPLPLLYKSPCQIPADQNGGTQITCCGTSCSQ